MEQTELERKEKIISLMQRSESEREWRKSKNNRQQSLTVLYVCAMQLRCALKTYCRFARHLECWQWTSGSELVKRAPTASMYGASHDFFYKLG